MIELAEARIYLDWNAAAPLRPDVAAWLREEALPAGNASSVHAEGRRARGRVEAARDVVAAALGAMPGQIVFTSGGTEALALALRGSSLPRRLIAASEHSAVIAAAPGAELIPVGADGLVDLDALERALGAEPALVAVMHVNNETGVIQPIERIYEMVRRAGGRLLVDAVQSAGKLPLPPGDFVAVSAHKLGGLAGTGALVARTPEGLQAVQKGGGQERGLRGGTENMLGILAFAKALERSDRSWIGAAEARRESFEARLLDAGAEIFGRAAPRLATTTMVRMPGAAASTQLIRFDLAGFAVSSGAACSSGKVAPSHVLLAMGVPPDAAGEAIRVSTGWSTTQAELGAFAGEWSRMARQRRAA